MLKGMFFSDECLDGHLYLALDVLLNIRTALITALVNHKALNFLVIASLSSLWENNKRLINVHTPRGKACMDDLILASTSATIMIRSQAS